LVKRPEEFEENIKDLRVLGKREIMGIIKFRNRIKATLKK
jgi:hypothetical protein